jgi:hypothetical protein
MRHSWESLLEHLWPSRAGPHPDDARRRALLQAAIGFAIVSSAGPEIFAAMEMTALLEVLGASLFLTAFAAGAKVAALNLWRAARNIALPAAQIYVIRSNAAVPAKAQALVYCAVNAAWWSGGILVLGISAGTIMDVVV